MVDTAEILQSLYRRFGDLPGIQIELHKSLVAVQVENAAASATVFLQGAQVSHYQLRNQPPLLWCSPLCDYRPGQPLRGGIPICWPWFGDLARNPDTLSAKAGLQHAPAHGFARQQQWQLDSIATPNPGLTVLTLSLVLADKEQVAWPFATRLSLQVTVGNSLALDFGVENLGYEGVCYSSALHTYFATSHIDNTVVDGLDGLEYIDTLLDWRIFHQSGPLRIDRETDRIYLDTQQPVSIVDSGWRRAITLNTRGSNSAVVWNPWNEKARRLSQFADDAYLEMLCIETANVDRDIVTLAPGAKHQLTLELTSQLLG